MSTLHIYSKKNKKDLQKKNKTKQKKTRQNMRNEIESDSRDLTTDKSKRHMPQF
jgi:hypothetical protein